MPFNIIYADELYKAIGKMSIKKAHHEINRSGQKCLKSQIVYLSLHLFKLSVEICQKPRGICG